MYEDTEANKSDRITRDATKDATKDAAEIAPETEKKDEIPQEKDSVVGPVLIWSILLIVLVLIIAVAR